MSRTRTRARRRTWTCHHRTPPLRSPLEIYLHDIGRTPLLSATEEISLSRQVREGHDPETATIRERQTGANARNHLVTANLRLVVSVSRRYQGRGLPLADLISEGNLGLFHAAGKFDGDRGFKFCTYATCWIEQYIRVAIKLQTRTVRVPAYLLDALSLMRKVAGRAYALTGHQPTIGEAVAMLTLCRERAAKLTTVARREECPVLSLDSVAAREENLPVRNLFADDSDSPDAEMLRAEESAGLRAGLEHLDERQRHVIIRRYGLDGSVPGTLRAVGLEIGVTRERVRQIEQEALELLRGEMADAG
jgi:RNA polymerase nonessential primary-like sigma factor